MCMASELSCSSGRHRVHLKKQQEASSSGHAAGHRAWPWYLLDGSGSDA